MGLYRENGREHGKYCLGFRVILGLYWGYIGIMEKKMESTIKGVGPPQQPVLATRPPSGPGRPAGGLGFRV